MFGTPAALELWPGYLVEGDFDEGNVRTCGLMCWYVKRMMVTAAAWKIEICRSVGALKVCSCRFGWDGFTDCSPERFLPYDLFLLLVKVDGHWFSRLCSQLRDLSFASVTLVIPGQPASVLSTISVLQKLPFNRSAVFSQEWSERMYFTTLFYNVPFSTSNFKDLYIKRDSLALCPHHEAKLQGPKHFQQVQLCVYFFFFFFMFSERKSSFTTKKAHSASLLWTLHQNVLM